MIDWRLADGHMRADHCLVMGILNVTPDSFSDGGGLRTPDAVARRAAQMVDAGADLLDIGGESTRPGHLRVPVHEELARVLPAIHAVVAGAVGVPISIDTTKPPVAAAALEAGASIINDVSACAEIALAEAAADAEAGYIVMRRADCQGGILAACRVQLEAARRRLLDAGVRREAVVVDPGLGFGARPGPRVDDNLALIDHPAHYAMDYPVLIGASRKRFVGTMAGQDDARSRDDASVAVAVRAARAGAAIVRVHDVAPTVSALRAAGL